MRQDKYEVGDIVEWNDFSSYIYYQDKLNSYYIPTYGPGPFKVLEIKTPINNGGMGHTQHLLLENIGTFSGFWFKPIDRNKSPSSSNNVIMRVD